jgi:hypothetical protein
MMHAVVRDSMGLFQALAYNPDDGFIYTMDGGVFQRYTTAGALDLTTLSQPPTPIPQDLVYIGGDQLIGVVDDSLYRYDAVGRQWTGPHTLSQSLPDVALAFDFGVLYAVSSGSDQLFTIDLATYDVAALGSHGGSSSGGLSTTCMSETFVQCHSSSLINCCVGTPYNFGPVVDKVDAADIVEASSTDFTVDVTYDDDHRLDITTFDVNDIVLTGELPDGFNHLRLTNLMLGPSGTLTVKATSTPTVVAGTGNQFVVTYTFSPPNGQWSVADTGEWSVEVVGNEVGEYMTTPKYVPARAYATFDVKSKRSCWEMCF